MVELVLGFWLGCTDRKREMVIAEVCVGSTNERFAVDTIVGLWVGKFDGLIAGLL